LLTEVRRMGSLPTATSGVTPSDVDIMAHADAELRDTLVPLMLGVREEFYERVFDTTITTGTAAYRINKRAALSRLNTVQWVGSDGSVFNLARLEPKRAAEISSLSSSGRPWAYYLEGSRVVLYPTPNVAGTLRVRAFVRPSQLCLSANVQGTNMVITAVSTAGANYLITSAAHGISVPGSSTSDVVTAAPSFEHLALDTAVTSYSATEVTMPTSAFTTAPAIGDYVTAPDKTPMIQLPVELHPALVVLTTARVLRALGKLSEADMQAGEAQRLVTIGIEALTPRVDTAARKIVGGPMWRRRGQWFPGAV
jgi:hypothetical protein